MRTQYNTAVLTLMQFKRKKIQHQMLIRRLLDVITICYFPEELSRLKINNKQQHIPFYSEPLQL